ncbi:hypothetical protein H2198_003509 [Neophaeococcomyces mojaviensis]|uniref:Uncharacterized protein n=1 Tax=Neophaeococcomyces mojaviensis TaxID=3383035 RepID=A0ACC3AB70_9EURO|nr:hypothetical protein H2198_003509 [Knufia sp. JES_112]
MKGYIIEGQEDRAPITPLSDTWAGYGRSIKLKPRLRAGTNPSKLSPLQLGRLMRRFKIRFTGKTSRWPSEYENCFKQIEAIGQVKFETYPTYLSKYVGCASADELRLRTIELVRKAGIDDQNNVNEDTLRHHVKPIVFKQLESALECQVCQKLWSTAEFASSTSSTAARSSHAAGEVYDIWFGSTRSRNGALQLLLISNFIRDWAYNTYRPNILACLAGGWDHVIGVVHTESVIRPLNVPSKVPEKEAKTPPHLNKKHRNDCIKKEVKKSKQADRTMKAKARVISIADFQLKYATSKSGWPATKSRLPEYLKDKPWWA